MGVIVLDLRPGLGIGPFSLGIYLDLDSDSNDRVFNASSSILCEL